MNKKYYATMTVHIKGMDLTSSRVYRLFQEIQKNKLVWMYGANSMTRIIIFSSEAEAKFVGQSVPPQWSIDEHGAYEYEYGASEDHNQKPVVYTKKTSI